MRLRRRSLLARWLIALGLAAASAGLALAFQAVPRISTPLLRLNDVLYDSLYALRPHADLTGGEVVIVAVDQNSLKAFATLKNLGWPWPRDLWGKLVRYCDACGAKVIAFDVLFTEQSIYEPYRHDDTALALAIDEMAEGGKGPVVNAAVVSPDGGVTDLALPLTYPAEVGAVNVQDSALVRSYAPIVFGRPSLASRAVELAGYPLPPWARPGSGRRADGRPDADGADPFLLHYYGPHRDAGGKPTFRYLPAAAVILAAEQPARAAEYGIDPGLFRGRIVLVGLIAAGTHDAKATPLSPEYPGVEIHATAIENFIRAQRVEKLATGWAAAAAFLGAALASAGAMLPRRASLKLLAVAGAYAALVGAAGALFRRPTISWLPWAAPLLATTLAVIFGFLGSYLSEDRQRRLMLKALSQVTSPAVAEELRRADRLELGGVKRNMTVMFTDIAGFTDLSESLGEEKIGALLNYYLDEMSSTVFSTDGTLDKYIGDAIMCFWNAPLEQADHAARACRAALAMRQREREIQPRLREMGAGRIFTRIGVATGAMIAGNMGSSRKIAYSVIGDSVNLASRLEGANKFYGTQILLSQTTAELVTGRFLLRKVDVLRVKGKLKPMAVYELLAEAAGEGADSLAGSPAHSSTDSPAAASLAARARAYEQAFAAYQGQRWDEAERILLELLGRMPQDTFDPQGVDPPSQALLARIARFRADPPPADWDGVYVAKEK